MNNEIKELRKSLGFEEMLQDFLSAYPIEDLIRFSETDNSIKAIINDEFGGTVFDIYCLFWNMELMLQKDSVQRISDIKQYLNELEIGSKIITNPDQGILEDKDIEQIQIMLNSLQKELDQKIRMIQTTN